jgi:hypothetical protein
MFLELVATRTTDKFTPEDLESAKKKIAAVAFTLQDSKKELDVSIFGLGSSDCCLFNDSLCWHCIQKFLDLVTLSAVELRELVRRNFLLKLTPGLQLSVLL